MGQRLNRSKKLIAFFFVFVFALSVGMYSTSFSSKAADLEFYLNYPEPQVTDTNGYFMLLLQRNNTGEYFVFTYFWTVAVYNSSDVLSPCWADITLSTSTFKFTIGGNLTGQNMQAYYILHDVTDNGNYYNTYSSSSSAFTRNFSNSGVTIKGFKYGGNVKLSFNGTFSALPFTVFFNTDGSSEILRDIYYEIAISHTDLLDELILIMQDSNNDLKSVLDWLEDIDNNFISVNENLHSLYEMGQMILNEQLKTNNWLEKIWQAILNFFTPNQDDEDKKNELEDEYQSQVDDLEDLDEGLELDKPPPEEVEEEIEDNLDVVEDEDEEDLEEFKDILSLILNNEYIIEMLLIVLTLILIAFVFYGKR